MTPRISFPPAGDEFAFRAVDVFPPRSDILPTRNSIRTRPTKRVRTRHVYGSLDVACKMSLVIINITLPSYGSTAKRTALRCKSPRIRSPSLIDRWSYIRIDHCIGLTPNRRVERVDVDPGSSRDTVKNQAVKSRLRLSIGIQTKIEPGPIRNRTL